MKIEMRKEQDGFRFPAAWIEENVRGEDVLKAPEFADLIEAKKTFSVAIAKGAGELFMKFEGGAWMQSVHSVDKCFGFIKGKYRQVQTA